MTPRARPAPAPSSTWRSPHPPSTAPSVPCCPWPPPRRRLLPRAPIPVDILIDNATTRIDSLSTHVVDATTGTDLTIAIQLSNYDAAVTIAAPPADQVTDAPLFGG